LSWFSKVREVNLTMAESREKPKYKTFIIHGKAKQWQVWLFLAILLVGVYYGTSYFARYLALKDIRLTEDVIDHDGVVLQTTGYSCGPACLTMLMRDYGIDVTQYEMAKAAYTGIFGTYSSSMKIVGRKYGFDVETKYLDFDGIVDTNIPMIMEESEHVVYLAPDLASRLIHVKDPMIGLTIMTKEIFYNYFESKEKKKCHIFRKIGE